MKALKARMWEVDKGLTFSSTARMEGVNAAGPVEKRMMSRILLSKTTVNVGPIKRDGNFGNGILLAFSLWQYFQVIFVVHETHSDLQ